MSNAGNLQNEAARALFDRFAEAFATFDATNIAPLFCSPSVALRKDGSVVLLSTNEDLVRYYQAALDGYHRDGCRSCRWSDLEVHSMGSRALMATVSWALLRSDGSIARSWRQSYCLNDHQNVPRIFASAIHSE